MSPLDLEHPHPHIVGRAAAVTQAPSPRSGGMDKSGGSPGVGTLEAASVKNGRGFGGARRRRTASTLTRGAAALAAAAVLSCPLAFGIQAADSATASAATSSVKTAAAAVATCAPWASATVTTAVMLQPTWHSENGVPTMLASMNELGARASGPAPTLAMQQLSAAEALPAQGTSRLMPIRGGAAAGSDSMGAGSAGAGWPPWQLVLASAAMQSALAVSRLRQVSAT